MNEREHAVLSLFYNEGNRELTPSFLAYRMRVSTRDATALLDKMVKHGTLDLDVDDNGNLLYRLPESERRLLSEQRKNHGAPNGHSAGSPPPRQGSRRPQGDARPYIRRNPDGQSRSNSPGADATPGYADGAHTTGSNPAISQRQSAHDGTDGSVYPVTSSSNPRSHSQQGTSANGTHSQIGYDEWYESAPGDTAHPNTSHAGHHGQPRHDSQQRPHGQYGSLPEHQALAPYQSADHHPAPRFGPYPDRERIPVLAGALSLLVPGLGQFYNGEVGKGVMLLFSCLLLSVFLLFWIVWIWSVIDAYMVAEQSNQKALMDDASSPHPHLLPEQRPPTSTTNSNAA